MSDLTSCCRTSGGYCQRCDILVGLDGLHVVAVERYVGGLQVVVESAAGRVIGCGSCGVVAQGHGW